MKALVITLLFAAIMTAGCGKKEQQTTEKQSEQKQTEQKQTEQKQTEQKQTEQKQTEQKQETAALQVSGTDKAVDIQCAGMTCTSCENSVKGKLKKIEGVKDVIADYKTNTVKASYDPAKTDADKIKDAITAAGYEVKSVK